MRDVVLTIAQVFLILIGLYLLFALFVIAPRMAQVYREFGAEMWPSSTAPSTGPLLLPILSLLYLGYSGWLAIRRFQGRVSDWMIALAVLMVLLPLVVFTIAACTSSQVVLQILNQQ